MKRLNKFVIALLALFAAVNAFALTATDIWQPDPNGNVRIMSDDGMTPTTFYMNCNVTIAGTGSLKATSTNGLGNIVDEFINVPVADSDTLRLLPTATGMVISTNTLLNKATCFVDATYFTMNKYARPITAMFDNSIASVTITGTFAFTGIDNLGLTRFETISVLTTTNSVSNYAYYRITQSTLTVISSPGLSGEPSGSLSPMGDTAKLYPRFGVDVGIGLTNRPITSTVYWISEQDTQKLPSTAVVFSSNSVIRFGSAPNGTMDYETAYKPAGNTW